MVNLIGISGKMGSGKDTVGKVIQYLTYVENYKNYCKERGIVCNIMKYESFIQDNNYDSQKQYMNWQIKKYADKLKQIIFILTGISVKDLEKEEVKSSKLKEEWGQVEKATTEQLIFEYDDNDGEDAIVKAKRMGWVSPVGELVTISTIWQRYKAPTTVREFLQRIGTDIMRDKVHIDVWINALFSEYIKPAEIALRETGGYSNDKNPFGFPNWIITDVRFINEAEKIKEKGGLLIRTHRKRTRVLEGASGTKFTIVELPGIDYKEHVSETELDDYNFHYHIDNNSTIEDLIARVREILIECKIIMS